MKLKSLFLLALAALLALAVPRQTRAAEVSFDFFYDSLSPYGDWIQVGDLGYCWRPSNVDENWAPYSDGYWTYTDAGWTWVSYEDFGGIVYHYGRWTKLEDEGWCWVPDYQWGPAWVSWRHNDDYVGWAPLPAEARWEPERGFSVWVDNSYDIGPNYYNFCRVNDFGAPVLGPVILPRRDNFVLLNNTVNITNISYNRSSGWVFNGGLDYAMMRRFTRRPIPTLKLVQNNNFSVVNNRVVNNVTNVTNVYNYNAVQRGNQLMVVAPSVTRPQPAQLTTLKAKVTKVIPQQKVTHGWNSVAPEQREALKAKFTAEAKGATPETAPARQVQPAELKVLPPKADPNAKVPMTTKVKVPNVPTVPAAGVPIEPATAVATPGPREHGKPGAPGLVKPFNPAEKVTGAPATPPENPAVNKREAAAAAAAEAAAKKQAAIEARQQMLQQQKQDQTAAADARKQEMEQKQQQMQAEKGQQLQEQQEIARARAAQGAAAKEKQMETQQNNPAREEAVERSKAQAAAREKMIEQSQNPQKPVPAKPEGKVPPKGKKLTPEEAAALKKENQ